MALNESQNQENEEQSGNTKLVEGNVRSSLKTGLPVTGSFGLVAP